jgi:hypothetical protein
VEYFELDVEEKQWFSVAQWQCGVSMSDCLHTILGPFVIPVSPATRVHLKHDPKTNPESKA